MAAIDIIVATIQRKLPRLTYLDKSQILLVIESIADLHHANARYSGDKTYCPILGEIMNLAMRRCDHKLALRSTLRLITDESQD